MLELLKKIKNWLFGESVTDFFWQDEWSQILEDRVDFYRRLDSEKKQLFEQHCFAFLQTTRVEVSGDVCVTDLDRLLIAASSVIPVWGFSDWPYLSVEAVVLFPGCFNRDFQCGQIDSTISGMVGSGAMSGKMALSKPDLIHGFSNDQDKHNVGVHEFVHILDMADGQCDGFPEAVASGQCSHQWFELVRCKIAEIEKRKSNINDYGATNNQEFFAVASEYFFERPLMLKNKHPKLYDYLSEFYQQNRAEIERDQLRCKVSSKKASKR